MLIEFEFGATETQIQSFLDKVKVYWDPYHKERNIEWEEEESDVMERHDIVTKVCDKPSEQLYPKRRGDQILTSKDYAYHKGSSVIVKTQDPFKSDRTLEGRFIRRDALDLYILISYRINGENGVDDGKGWRVIESEVTIPNEMVVDVRLA